MRAVVVGGASCVWDDIRELEKLAGTLDEWIVVAVNDIGIRLPRIDHWVSLHPRLPRGRCLLFWAEQRRKQGLPDAGQLWCGERQANDARVKRLVKRRGGASGMLGVDVAEEEGCTKKVLCGMPMDNRPHFAESTVHDARLPWSACHQYQRVWQKYADELRRTTRSMSGWTRDLLGAPTREWLVA